LRRDIQVNSLLQSCTGCSSIPSLSLTSARSRMTRPSLYLWFSSVANSYIQPSFALQFLQNTSLTMCRPVNITLSCTSLYFRLTTLLNRKARPVAPVNLVEMSSPLLVRTVSQLLHENNRLPPQCSMNILPMLYHTNLRVLYTGGHKGTGYSST